MSDADSRLLTPRMMAHWLTQKLNDEDAGEHEARVEVAIAPRYCGLLPPGHAGMGYEACTVSFLIFDSDGAECDEVTIQYPAADLTLPIETFAERHLAPALDL